MAESAPQQAPDPLIDNPEVIAIIMELYVVDEQVAKQMWGKFIGTVRKMKVIVQEQK
jgi:hypothetical protein